MENKIVVTLVNELQIEGVQKKNGHNFAAILTMKTFSNFLKNFEVIIHLAKFSYLSKMKILFGAQRSINRSN